MDLCILNDNKKYLNQSNGWMDAKRLLLFGDNIEYYCTLHNKYLKEYNRLLDCYNTSKEYYTFKKLETASNDLKDINIDCLNYFRLSLQQLSDNNLTDSQLYDLIGLLRNKIGFFNEVDLNDTVNTINTYY